jgi:hypothetical protein
MDEQIENPHVVLYVDQEGDEQITPVMSEAAAKQRAWSMQATGINVLSVVSEAYGKEYTGSFFVRYTDGFQQQQETGIFPSRERAVRECDEITEDTNNSNIEILPAKMHSSRTTEEQVQKTPEIPSEPTQWEAESTWWEVVYRNPNLPDPAFTAQSTLPMTADEASAAMHRLIQRGMTECSLRRVPRDELSQVLYLVRSDDWRDKSTDVERYTAPEPPHLAKDRAAEMKEQDYRVIAILTVKAVDQRRTASRDVEAETNEILDVQTWPEYKDFQEPTEEQYAEVEQAPHQDEANAALRDAASRAKGLISRDPGHRDLRDRDRALKLALKLAKIGRPSKISAATLVAHAETILKFLYPEEK